MSDKTSKLEALWARHNAAWRDSAQVASQWSEANQLDPRLLKFRVTGHWWETLAACRTTLIVTREYEHLVIAMRAGNAGPEVSFLALPHPSGVAFDRRRGVVHIASTRNPNQIFEFAPATSYLPRLDAPTDDLPRDVLLPVRSQFLPGCLYLHDLAMIGDDLHATSVGQNAIIRFSEPGVFEPVWHPRCMDTAAGAVYGRNHIQLNSIAAGSDLAHSFFTASGDHVARLRPGHRGYPVDQRGVIFSGKTREPVVRGLTRPHSARFYQDQLWVDNSGYGELVKVEGEAGVPVVKLKGWTRGLAFQNGIAFVGTSRIIPRFRQYAPGVDSERSLCGIHAWDLRSEKIVGSLIWPAGNQIFAIECLPFEFTRGFPFPCGRKRPTEQQKRLFYAFSTAAGGHGAARRPRPT